MSDNVRLNIHTDTNMLAGWVNIRDWDHMQTVNVEFGDGKRFRTVHLAISGGLILLDWKIKHASAGPGWERTCMEPESIHEAQKVGISTAPASSTPTIDNVPM